MSEALQELADILEVKQADAFISSEISNGELTVHVNNTGLVAFVEFLQTNASTQFTTLIDITAVDYPSRDKRFDVVYHFLSMTLNHRIRLKVRINDGEMVETITALHPSAGWFEREVFDMYGILFANHPDLRRLLTDYGFQGHPLRKDFPTTGYVELRYDEVEKRCIYEPVTLTQEYRQFDFMSPWEGAEYILPGDEKVETK